MIGTVLTIGVAVVGLALLINHLTKKKEEMCDCGSSTKADCESGACKCDPETCMCKDEEPAIEKDIVEMPVHQNGHKTEEPAVAVAEEVPAEETPIAEAPEDGESKAPEPPKEKKKKKPAPKKKGGKKSKGKK